MAMDEEERTDVRELRRIIEEHVEAERSAREASRLAEEARWHRLTAWQDQVRSKILQLTGDVQELSVQGLPSEEMRIARDLALAAGPSGSMPRPLDAEEKRLVAALAEELISRLRP